MSGLPGIGRRAAPWAALAVLSLGLYAPNWSDYFLGDDFDLIHSFHGQPPSYFVALLWSNESGDVWRSWGIDPALGRGFLRPLKIWLLAFDFAVWRTNPLGYHLTSSLFFVANVLIVFAILRRALAGRNALALAGAGAVALHPVFSEVVPFVTAREELMASALGLGAFLAFLRSRTEGRSALGFHVCYALALLSKETALPLLALPVGWDLTHGRLWPWSATTRRALRTYVPSVAIVLAYFTLRRVAFGNFLGGDGQPTRYFSPAALLEFHARFARSLVDGTLFSAGRLPHAGLAIAILTVIALVLLVARRDRIPSWRRRDLLFFGPLWYLGSTAILYGAYFAVRHCIVPVIGLLIFATLLVDTALQSGWLVRERRCAAAWLAIAAVMFLPPTLDNSADFRKASAAVRSIRQAIEDRSSATPPGSAVALSGVPQWIVPPYFFGWGLLSALQLPFTASDLAARSSVIDARNVTLTRVQVELPQHYDLAIEIDEAWWSTPELEQRYLERLWRDGIVPRGVRAMP